MIAMDIANISPLVTLLMKYAMTSNQRQVSLKCNLSHIFLKSLKLLFYTLWQTVLNFGAAQPADVYAGQNINKYLNKPAKGCERMIQRFQEDLATLVKLGRSLKMKEYFSQKWLVGEDGETPILSSTESTELCPSDESTFSYANDTQVQ